MGTSHSSPHSDDNKNPSRIGVRRQVSHTIRSPPRRHWGGGSSTNKAGSSGNHSTAADVATAKHGVRHRVRPKLGHRLHRSAVRPPRPNSLPGGSGGPKGVINKLRGNSGGLRGMEVERTASLPRGSFRMVRQPSTYGQLHDFVAQKKLGAGVVKGLVGTWVRGHAHVRRVAQCQQQLRLVLASWSRSIKYLSLWCRVEGKNSVRTRRRRPGTLPRAAMWLIDVFLLGALLEVWPGVAGVATRARTRWPAPTCGVFIS